MTIHSILLYLDFDQDESYTPQKLHLRAGSHWQDLQQIMSFEFLEPKGWVTLPVSENGSCIRAHMIQVVSTQNHQSGRDVHVRQARALGPRECTLSYDPLSNFTSDEFKALSSIR
eukprot:c7208_g1_i2.p1 GENE.c7208_g1_i2~~c7208_g1_i2.p1  ORF type:complete len:115 (+),score=4.97 c7208_g1_i2:209-553(+)